MKRTLMSVICLLALNCAASNAATMFTAALTGAQEVPPVATSATGTASLTLNDTMDELAYEVVIKGLDFGGFFTPDPDDDITRLHIHDGDVGVNGPVVLGILAPTHDLDALTIMVPATDEVKFTGVWDVTDVSNGAASLASQLADLFAGGLYFNLHTSGNAGGEIRGQITFIPEPTAAALASLACVCLGLRMRK